MRYGMVIDMRRCVGCHACTVACKQKNATPPGIFWGKVMIKEEGKYPNAKPVSMPLLCNHCQDAACVNVCPTGASHKTEEGPVLIDHNKCIGCRACIVACPYDTRSYLKKYDNYYPGKGKTEYERYREGEHTVGTASKCNFCVDRLAEDKDPLCVQTCIARARVFGDLDDPDGEVAKLVLDQNAQPLLPEMGTSPSVYYIQGKTLL
ncbi:4Fe-4S dicluster domain-containing protein [Thermodesulfobacteriota bacterium]